MQIANGDQAVLDQLIGASRLRQVCGNARNDGVTYSRCTRDHDCVWRLESFDLLGHSSG